MESKGSWPSSQQSLSSVTQLQSTNHSISGALPICDLPHHFRSNMWSTVPFSFQYVIYCVIFIPICDLPCHFRSNMWSTATFSFQYVICRVIFVPICDISCHFHSNMWSTAPFSFQYVIYRAIFVPICDLPLTTPHTASDVPPATP